METGKVRFAKEKETLLITLYGKAIDSRSSNPVLGDKWAADAVSRIDYDFGKLKVSALEALVIAIRSKNFDVWTAGYLAGHPDATVIHLGCGMDSRVYRLDPAPGVRWFDVDYPEVVELRRRVYPERPGYCMIGSSLANLSWLDQVPRDRPAMIVAEGVMMYLTRDIVKPLLNGLTSHFPSGQMAFDALSRLSLRTTTHGRTVKGTGASYGWGIDDPQEIKALEPKLDLIAEVRTPDLVDYSRLPFAIRALARVMDAIPVLRRMNRVLLYQF
jgi:O-methyltransferase involved in polyketide biosynthesis